MILTRSRTRRELFCGQGAGGVRGGARPAASSRRSRACVAGLLFTGEQSLVGLDGRPLSSGDLLVSVSLVAGSSARCRCSRSRASRVLISVDRSQRDHRRARADAGGARDAAAGADRQGLDRARAARRVGLRRLARACRVHTASTARCSSRASSAWRGSPPASGIAWWCCAAATSRAPPCRDARAGRTRSGPWRSRPSWSRCSASRAIGARSTITPKRASGLVHAGIRTASRCSSSGAGPQGARGRAPQHRAAVPPRAAAPTRSRATGRAR